MILFVFLEKFCSLADLIFLPCNITNSWQQDTSTWVFTVCMVQLEANSAGMFYWLDVVNLAQDIYLRIFWIRWGYFKREYFQSYSFFLHNYICFPITNSLSFLIRFSAYFVYSRLCCLICWPSQWGDIS